MNKSWCLHLRKVSRNFTMSPTFTAPSWGQITSISLMDHCNKFLPSLPISTLYPSPPSVLNITARVLLWKYKYDYMFFLGSKPPVAPHVSQSISLSIVIWPFTIYFWYPCNLIQQSLGLLCSSHTGLPLFLKQSRRTPPSSIFHWLFLLPGMLFPQVFCYLLLHFRHSFQLHYSHPTLSSLMLLYFLIALIML